MAISPVFIAAQESTPVAPRDKAHLHQLSGIVVDTSGAVIIAATVQIRSANGTVQMTTQTDANGSYQINERWRVSAEFLNLLNRRDHDIDYAYTSRITSTASPVFTDVFHPVEPFQVRFGLRATFGRK